MLSFSFFDSTLSSGGTKEEGSRRAGDDDGQAAQQQSRRADAGTQGEKGKSDMGFCSTVCMFIYPSVLCVHIWLLCFNLLAVREHLG